MTCTDATIRFVLWVFVVVVVVDHHHGAGVNAGAKC